MAITSNTYTGNGTNKLFSITFPYLEESDVDVYLNGTLQTITTQYSFANATTIEFVTAPANGTTVKISRSTDDSAVSATFFPGSSIKANDLNANFDQTLYVVQEINNTAVDKTGDTMSGNLDMGGNRITTLGAPTTDTDAANKQYIDSRLGEIGIPGHTRWSKTATAGQTVLSGVGSEGNTLEYSASREQVFVNGALLQRNVDYTANDGLIITMLSPLILGDVVDVRCVNNLPEGIDGLASDITFLQAGTGAVSRSVDSKLKDTVHINDFNGDIAAAVTSLPSAGGTVVLSAGTYVSPYTAASPLTKSGVTFQGAGMPGFKSDYTGLENGTIIQGTLSYKASNCSFKDLGIDVGSAVCTALNGGTAMEGLVSASNTFDVYYHNNHIRNVAVICKDSGAAVHAILFESQEEGSISNVATVYAAAGVVLKARRVSVDGVYARSHSNYAFLIKSDRAGGTCNEINVSNLLLETTGNPAGMVPGAGANWDTNGLVLLPVTESAVPYPVTNVNITNVIARNVKNGINFDTTAGGSIKNVSISNFAIENCFFAGVSIEPNSSVATLSDGVITSADYNVLNGGDKIVFHNVSSIGSKHHSFESYGTDVVFTDCTADTPLSISYRGFEITGGSATIRNANYRSITTNKYATSGGATVVVEDVPALNTTSQSILNYLRRGLITEIEAISGAGSVVAAWFASPEPDTTSMTDWSTYGTHVATYRNGSTLATATRASAAIGLGHYKALDANFVWDAADASDLSFGNGATDSPFSIVSLCRPITSFTGHLVAKLNNTTASPQREWLFFLGASAGLYFQLLDNSTGGAIGRRYNVSLGSLSGLWTTFSATYSGSSTSAGMKCYINDTQVDNVDLNSGTYVAMENTTAKVGSYELNTAGSPASHVYADMAVNLVFNVQLSAANIIAIRKKLIAYFAL